MLKRTLVFSSPMHLSLRNAQLVVSTKEAPNEQRTVPIEDIGLVMIENQMVTVTMPLLNTLVDAGVAVILCDAKGMPHAMLQNMDGNNLQGECLRNQISMGEVTRKQLWKQIVEAKIRNQSALLQKIHGKGDILKPYYTNVKSGDSDNREGIAAKIYWNELFGDKFIRSREGIEPNNLLNYGYTLLRAAVARALMGSGLLPALGIFHRNRYNAFPLADDIMEPYRPYVDEIVYHMYTNGIDKLDKDAKSQLLNILFTDTVFNKVTRPLEVGLTMTTASLAKCYMGSAKKISYPLLE